MNKSLAAGALAFTLLVLAGCGAEAASHAIGIYAIDKLALNSVATVGMTVDQAAEVVSSLEGSMELKADGTAILTMKIPPLKIDGSSTGTWRLDGDKLSLTAKGDDGKESTKVVDYKDGAFRLPGEGKLQMTLTFRKK